MADAAKYNVLPLDDRFAERLDVTLRSNYFLRAQEGHVLPRDDSAPLECGDAKEPTGMERLRLATKMD